MKRGIGHLAKKLIGNSSGNAMMLVGLGLPVLIGGAGLGVDIAQWYMWKGEVQHSVDQAALAAAFALSADRSSTTYEKRASQEFNANQNVTATFTSDPKVLLASYAGGNDNSVIVTASASKSLPFSGYFMSSAATVTATAQAAFTPGGNWHACLVATNDDTTSIDIGGNATVKAQCGIAALSCDDNAVLIDGSATVTTDSIATCGTASVPEENESVVTEKVTGLTDIYKDLAPPDDPTPQNYSCEKTKGQGTIAALQPGTYKGGIVVKCTTVLAGGIYVIDGGTLDLTANYNVTGTNVMFVLKNGASIKLGGSGNGNKINLSPIQAPELIDAGYGDYVDKYAGMLVFEDRNNAASNPGHLLNGNSNSMIEGIMYLPANGIMILGTADVTAQCLQISAKTITIGGNAYIETLCPPDETQSAGSSAPRVRLVR